MPAPSPQNTVDDPASIDAPRRSRQSADKKIGDFFKTYSMALSLIGSVLVLVWSIAHYSGELTSDVDNLGKVVKDVSGEVKDVRVELGSVRDKVQNLAEDVSYIRGRLDERGEAEPPAPTKLSDSHNLSMHPQ